MAFLPSFGSFKPKIAGKLCFFMGNAWDKKVKYLPPHTPLFNVNTSPTTRVDMHLKQTKSHCFNCLLIFHLQQLSIQCVRFHFSPYLLLLPQDLRHLSSQPRWICARVAAGVSQRRAPPTHVEIKVVTSLIT